MNDHPDTSDAAMKEVSWTQPSLRICRKYTPFHVQFSAVKDHRGDGGLIGDLCNDAKDVGI